MGESQKSVFISYSSKDRKAGLNLTANLVDQNLQVLIDVYSLEAGTNLEKSLRSKILNSDYTICLISEHSLQSPWVMWEIQQVISQQGSILPVSLDQSFQDDKKVESILDQAEERVSQLKEDINAALNKDQPIDHLNDKIKQQRSIIERLPETVSYLRSVNVIHLDYNNYENSFRKLFKEISGSEKLVQNLIPKEQINKIDPGFCQEEIFNLLLDNDLIGACKKIMEYIREHLENDSSQLKNAGLLSFSITRTLKDYEINKKANPDKIVELSESHRRTMDEYAEKLMNLIPFETQSAA